LLSYIFFLFKRAILYIKRNHNFYANIWPNFLFEKHTLLLIIINLKSMVTLSRRSTSFYCYVRLLNLFIINSKNALYIKIHELVVQLQWTRQFRVIVSFGSSTVSGHRKFRVNFRKRYLFFPNGIVFRYFDYPVIFSNLLAAWNVMLAVET